MIKEMLCVSGKMTLSYKIEIISQINSNTDATPIKLYASQTILKQGANKNIFSNRKKTY